MFSKTNILLLSDLFLLVQQTLIVIFIFTARGQERNMAAVKSKSGIYCSSNLKDNAEGTNRSKMSFSMFDTFLVLISMVTFIVDLSTGEELFQELFSQVVSCII
jgi:hypothetical protein